MENFPTDKQIEEQLERLWGVAGMRVSENIRTVNLLMQAQVQATLILIDLLQKDIASRNGLVVQEESQGSQGSHPICKSCGGPITDLRRKNFCSHACRRAYRDSAQSDQVESEPAA